MQAHGQLRKQRYYFKTTIKTVLNIMVKSKLKICKVYECNVTLKLPFHIFWNGIMTFVYKNPPHIAKDKKEEKFWVS